MSTFPTQPEQLTAAWFTTALRDAGVLAPDRSVTSFDVSVVGDGIGLIGMVVRAALVYDGPADAAVLTRWSSSSHTPQRPTGPSASACACTNER